MNMLNSLIIEGVAKEDASILIRIDDDPCTSFEIETSRFFKDENGEVYEEKSTFEVWAEGRLGDFVKDKVKKGSKVRVVGRLKQKLYKNNSKIFIIAEHIENLARSKENENA